MTTERCGETFRGSVFLGALTCQRSRGHAGIHHGDTHSAAALDTTEWERELVALEVQLEKAGKVARERPCS